MLVIVSFMIRSHFSTSTVQQTVLEMSNKKYCKMSHTFKFTSHVNLFTSHMNKFPNSSVPFRLAHLSGQYKPSLVNPFMRHSMRGERREERRGEERGGEKRKGVE